jgi:hypothetical protein
MTLAHERKYPLPNPLLKAVIIKKFEASTLLVSQRVKTDIGLADFTRNRSILMRALAFPAS